MSSSLITESFSSFKRNLLSYWYMDRFIHWYFSININCFIEWEWFRFSIMKILNLGILDNMKDRNYFLNMDRNFFNNFLSYNNLFQKLYRMLFFNCNNFLFYNFMNSLLIGVNRNWLLHSQMHWIRFIYFFMNRNWFLLHSYLIIFEWNANFFCTDSVIKYLYWFLYYNFSNILDWNFYSNLLVNVILKIFYFRDCLDLFLYY